MPDPDARAEDAASAPASGSIPETIATYLRLRGLEPSARSFRKRRRRVADDENQPFTSGRDPRGVGDVLAALTREAGWDKELAREDVVRAWSDVAGDDTARHTRGRFHQRLVLVTVVIRRSVKPTTKSPDFLLVHQPTQILAGVVSRDHIPRTEYPQPAGVVARDLETSPSVTFCFHFLTYGVKT